jgi:hypothetical protein
MVRHVEERGWGSRCLVEGSLPSLHSSGKRGTNHRLAKNSTKFQTEHFSHCLRNRVFSFLGNLKLRFRLIPYKVKVS